MTSSDPSHREGSSRLSVDERIDGICDEFESGWLGEQRPDISSYLAAYPEAERGVLLRELLLLDIEYRTKAGEQPTQSEYAERFPGHPGVLDEVFAEVTCSKQRALYIRCPQCRSPVELSDETPLSEISCPSCGSSFSLVNDETVVSELAADAVLGHFHLLQKLGTGAFGTVWEAKDSELDRIVAIKVPRKGQLDSEETEKFLREARAAAQLRHPNIVSVHEVGRDGETVYIVTDLVQGLTLSDWLTGQRLSTRKAVELCVTIAEALHHAHEKGVIHRDLKPGNVMLDADGIPHVMDFGLAKREAGEITMTRDGHVLGTPAYMPPEQAQGQGHDADPRSDVYSLGVILFELLTGERPFRGNVRMLIHQVIHEEAPSPRSLNPQIPRDVETICLKCLQKEPADRYSTAAALAGDLERYLAGLPIVARPLSLSERACRWYQAAHRLPEFGILSVTMGLIGTSTIAVALAMVLLEIGPLAGSLRAAAFLAILAVFIYFPLLGGGLLILRGDSKRAVKTVCRLVVYVSAVGLLVIHPIYATGYDVGGVFSEIVAGSIFYFAFSFLITILLVHGLLIFLAHRNIAP